MKQLKQIRISAYRKCPQSLLPTIIKIVIEEIRNACKKQPILCGFNPPDSAYEPLKLMQTVMAKTNEVCLRYLDNSTLCTLPSPGPPHNATSVFAIKNTRRRMEDRHVVIHDLNTMFNVQEASPSSYYAIFDGHAGHDAAAYSAAHLHQYLAENENFASNPSLALKDAFCKTDALFIEKCKVESLSSGTTAVCALLRPKEKTLYVAWVGDSQALIACQGRIMQCVEPHKPCREDEKNRIEQEGGVVIFWGTWRVNGQLAVSRAIGDYEYKPYVIAIPDVREVPLSGGEDFVILACDGLWDFLSENDAARMVYQMVRENPDDTDSISQRLVLSAKERGSSDNISVIVVFLREPSKVAAEAQWADRNGMDAALENAPAAEQQAQNNNPFASEILKEHTPGFLFEGFKQQNAGLENALSPENGTGFGRNGKASSDFDEDEDLGPETDVDAVDDAAAASPGLTTEKIFGDGMVVKGKEEEEEDSEMVDHHLEVQKKQSSEFDAERSPREETPTPPADAVHDASGLVDNVADSGEESEDEWNYYKGDAAGKENIPPPDTDAEVAELTAKDPDTMSQLNPDAAEFVPVSPTRNLTSPACAALINDPVIAQSPRRASGNMDISVPNPQEFESEVKSRPSEVLYSNGHESEGGQKLTSQEIMENLLNGKNLEEIEFQPLKGEEFHFGPNASPFTPTKPLDQSEAVSTKAVFGDESVASYMDEKSVDHFESTFADTDISAIPEFHPKGQDPMSTSFYQDREDDNNPFDLNKVQVLPDNLEAFLSKPDSSSSFNETISDLPLHDPLAGVPKDLVTDLDKPAPEPEKTADLLGDFQSPTGESDSSFEHIASPVRLEPFEEIKAPQPAEEELVCQRPDSKASEDRPQSQTSEGFGSEPEPVCLRPESKSPLPELESPVPGAVEDVCPRPESKSPALQITPEPTEELCSRPAPEPDVCLRPESPAPEPEECLRPDTKSPAPALQSPAPEPDVCLRPESKSPAPVDDVCLRPESPAPDACLRPELKLPSPEAPSPVPSEEICLATAKSPEPQAPPTPEPLGDICERPEATTPDIPVEEISSDGVASPVEDVTSSVKEEAVSPVPRDVESPRVERSNFEEEVSHVQEVIVPEVSEGIEEALLNSTPKSVISDTVDVESVVTAEVNSMLERCNLPDFASPLSASEVTGESTILSQNESPILEPKPEESAKSPVDVAAPAEILPEAGDSQKEEKPAAEPEKIAAAVAAGTVAVAAAAAAAVATEKKTATKPKPTTTPKKPAAAAKTTPAKAPAPAARKPALPAAAKPSTPTSKPPTPKPATRTTPTAAAKPTATTPKTKPAAPKPPSAGEKKPLTNGDVKTAPRTSMLTKRPSDPLATKSARVPLTKTSPTKPLARPQTAPAATKAPAAPAAPRPKPMSLAAKTAPTARAAPKPTSVKAAAPAPKPRPATAAPPKARVPLTKTITKGPEAEKQLKETANKQLSASRTATSRTVAGKTTTTTTTTVRKTEAKVPASRTTTTKTTVTSLKATAKKPETLTRLVGGKAKPAGKAPAKPQQNGVAVVEEITVVTSTTVAKDENESRLVKDNSPIDNNIIIDSIQLLQSNNAD